MNSTLIKMDPEEAKTKLRAYRSRLHKDSEEVYSQVAKGYEAMAAGTPLIELTPAIREAGFDARGRPNLAIGRADRKEVRLTWRNGRVASFDSAWQYECRGSELLVRNVDMGKNGPGWMQIYARIPMVPADVRPATGQLRDWYVLWEVTDWSEKPHTAEPPRDPFLLKHIGGDLYAVLAEWDLTDLERAVMRTQALR